MQIDTPLCPAPNSRGFALLERKIYIKIQIIVDKLYLNCIIDVQEAGFW
jgi:hypothetical protein